jgi:hypothetical protein
MNYCNISDIENYKLKEIDSVFESQVEAWIEAVSLMMDNMANRKLVAEIIGSGDDYETKYYDGDSTNNLFIDDAQEITELTISDEFGDNPTTLTSSEYAITPKTAPHKKIILRDTYFPYGVQNITVKGNFGLFNEVPNDIRFACVVIVSGIINANDPANKDKTSVSIGNYSVSYDSDKGIADYSRALSIIDYYRKIQY